MKDFYYYMWENKRGFTLIAEGSFEEKKVDKTILGKCKKKQQE